MESATGETEAPKRVWRKRRCDRRSIAPPAFSHEQTCALASISVFEICVDSGAAHFQGRQGQLIQ